MKILYTAHATAKGGRVGHVETDDKLLAFDLVKPWENTGQKGTNPEQLFACGYAACFGGAIEHVAKQDNVHVVGTTVNANVSFIQEDKGGFKLGVELKVHIPNVNKAMAEKLVQEAHQICPYSKATRNNIEVKLTVI
jgi:lipoyl-dependent peroxiredoxin